VRRCQHSFGSMMFETLASVALQHLNNLPRLKVPNVHLVILAPADNDLPLAHSSGPERFAKTCN
jgi:hypothetical protein